VDKLPPGVVLPFAGVGSVWKSLISLARFVLGDARWREFERIKLLVLKGPLELVLLSLRTPSILLFPVGIIPSVLYTFSAVGRKSVILTDIFAMSFSHNALSLLKLDSFKTGCILLSGLFFYDIWWVFGTEVMVSVATSLDVPIKLLWPKSLSFTSERGFTILGLGDIVIPGIFVALALRYDYHRHSKSSPQSSFIKPYFFAALGAYIAGLVVTMTIMHVFKKAQPALLYLSPACILSFLITALIRGELKSAWSWTDEPEQPLAPAEAVSVDTKYDGNESIPGGAEMPEVEEKVETEPDASEAESKPKKKKNKKKAT